MKANFYLWLSKLLSRVQRWALRRSVYFSYKAVGLEGQVKAVFQAIDSGHLDFKP